MTAPLVAAGLWVIAANLAVLLPRARSHVVVAVLIAAGVPLLGWVTYEGGPWIGLAAFVAGVAFIRWPLWPFAERVRPHAAPPGPAE